MARFQTLSDIDVAGRRVFVRADLNVPMQDGHVTDATRIAGAAQTVDELANAGGRVLVASHFGRPKGIPNPNLSLRPLAEVLSDHLNGRPVTFVEGVADVSAGQAMADSEPGQVFLMENLRFDAGEEANEPGFVSRLAGLADLYVDDAFSCAHRIHASIVGVAERLPAAAGRLMQRELEMLGRVLNDPERPIAALVGGSKISTKLAVLEHLVEHVDHLIVGGAMANTFMTAKGLAVGTSLCEVNMIDTALAVLAIAEAKGCRVALPVDVTVADSLQNGATAVQVSSDAVPDRQMILDIGCESVVALKEILAGCHTLVWNGPLGAFEFKPFDRGTTAVAQAAAELTQSGKLLSVAGGGDTVAALAHAEVTNKMSYISTAGGAFLEWLEGRPLPGVEVLRLDR